MADLIAALMARTPAAGPSAWFQTDRKSTRLNSSHSQISYAVFCLKKKTRRLNSSHRQISYDNFCFKKLVTATSDLFIRSLKPVLAKESRADPFVGACLHELERRSA